MGSAVEALRIGAQDYVEKPSPELDTIGDRVQSAIQAVQLRDEHEHLLRKLAALEEQLKDRDRQIQDQRLEQAISDRVATVRVDEAKELMRMTARQRDERLVESAKTLLLLAHGFRGGEKLISAIQSHIVALRTK
jgi:hypothetical protein